MKMFNISVVAPNPESTTVCISGTVNSNNNTCTCDTGYEGDHCGKGNEKHSIDLFGLISRFYITGKG